MMQMVSFFSILTVKLNHSNPTTFQFAGFTIPFPNQMFKLELVQNKHVLITEFKDSFILVTTVLLLRVLFGQFE